LWFAGSDNPDQQFLIKPEPDLRPLRDWIIGQLSRRPERWQDLAAAVRPEWWLPKHVKEVVRELKKEGAITADTVPGRTFGAAANPLLRLAKPGPGTLRKRSRPRLFPLGY
jgi:hypothetical protein